MGWVHRNSGRRALTFGNGRIESDLGRGSVSAEMEDKNVFDLGVLREKVWEFNGLQLTVGGLILVVVIAYLVYRAR